MVDLPDFHIPHAEKIDWMIETNGWALEAVAPQPDGDPPVPGYAYTIGLPGLLGFPEIIVFGLTPAAANGLITMVVDQLRAGTEIPIGVEVVGLLDNELRCRLAPIAEGTASGWFATAHAWHRGAPMAVVQLLYPDRSGWLPYELGYEARMRFAQPVVGDVDDAAAD